jgi:protein-disulfide isomerase
VADAKANGGDWRFSLVAALLGILIGGAAMFLLSGSGTNRAETEQVVREYILANPEILPQAMDRLQQRQAGQAVAANRAAIETPFHGAWAGAANADVTLVEFFDYACGYCRASNDHIARLLREDPRLRVVWREYPVLGPASEQAAVASLAAAQAGRYRPFYDALFGAGRPTEQSIAAARAAVGIGPARLTDEYRTELQRNYQLARALGASGTPTFVVGDQVLHGAVGYDALRAAIAQARRARS